MYKMVINNVYNYCNYFRKLFVTFAPSGNRTPCPRQCLLPKHSPADKHRWTAAKLGTDDHRLRLALRLYMYISCALFMQNGQRHRCFQLDITSYHVQSCLTLSGLIWVHPTGKHPGSYQTCIVQEAIYYSCVGIWQNGRVEIIANDLGNRVTPSLVSFSDNERLIGDAAKNQAYRNPQNTYVAISC